ncbi:fuculose phosphate aldolase [Sesbania bispinosa]|nr:fuculose phosphate aldolase [Sesbania bispinosa]
MQAADKGVVDGEPLPEPCARVGMKKKGEEGSNEVKGRGSADAMRYHSVSSLELYLKWDSLLSGTNEETQTREYGA